MKTFLKSFIFFIIVINLSAENIFPKANSLQLFNSNKIGIIINDSSKVVVDNLYWGNSLYISTGYSIPLGYRFEFGYNFGTAISLAATFSIEDNWSKEPDKGSLGILGKLHLPQIQSVSPYILVAFGGGFDSYTLVQIGSKISLINWLHICPEIGLVFTSKHISGGGESIQLPWGWGSTEQEPEVNEKRTMFGFNISFEIDFRQLF
jgi:hypothetical protein